MKTEPAPDFSLGYPSRGKKIGPAWAEVWAELSRYPRTWRDGLELWNRIAPQYDLHPATLRGVLFRAAVGGYLERRIGKVATDRGPRARTQFRIKEQDRAS